MKIKFVIILFATVLSIITFGQKLNYVDPTGIYKLDSKTTKKNGETYGYFGDMKVIVVDSARILINFYVCKGAPSYNSGSFIDTLKYLGNVALYYGDTISDSTCKMTMAFNNAGVDVDLKSENPNFACGFGHAVDSQGYYKKIIGQKPKKEEMLNDEK